MAEKLSVKLGVGILVVAYSLSFLAGYLLAPPAEMELEEYLVSPLFLLVQGTFSLALLLLTLLAAHMQRWQMAARLRVEPSMVAAGAALGAGMFLFERVSYHYLSQYLGESQLQRALVEAARSQEGLAVMLLVGALLAPVSEEVYFRGYMFTALAGRLGAKAGVVLSSAYFAAVHLDARAFIPIFVLGAILAVAYAKTRSLTLVIVAHMVINSTTFLLSYLGVEV
ncbi:MAG: CPBP family intramembrane metalloprotease [Euryarchaeota archaeon]|nr:CPBP family intramembrane metalloprotease [Euryarchaeota archaeon]